MDVASPHMFSLEEAAAAYALAAESILGGDAALLNDKPTVVPIFVSMLFQSLEIAIKHAGIKSELFTIKQTAVNLPKTIDILSQWRSSSSKSKHFAIWLQGR